MFGLTVLFCLFPIWYVARYNLHMLQLNTYINKEHYSWINDNFKKQWLLVAVALVGILQIVFVNKLVLAIEWLLFLLTNVIFKLTCEMNNKKPLHFTARAKRILVTDFILCAIVVALFCFLLGFEAACGAVSLVMGLQIVFVPLANTLNVPEEKLVKRHYINQAKAILKSCENLTIIGITGSYGKTSMKFYLAELLQSKFNVLMTPESYNTPMGIVKTIRESLTPSHDIFICEMGARYVGEIKEICDIVHPDAGIITSVGPAHLMTFGSLENIAKTKFELADALLKDPPLEPGPLEDGPLFLNGDSELVMQELDKRASEDIYDNATVYSVEADFPTDYTSTIQNVTCNGTNFMTVGCEDYNDVFHTRLVGAHNVINLTGAIAVAKYFRVEDVSIAVSVRKIRPVPHRMELKKTGDVTIIDDAFNSNPVGSAAAVETLSMFDGVRVLLTPGMVELGKEEERYNFEFGERAASCVDWIVLVGEEHTRPIKNGALRAGFSPSNIAVFDTFDEAIQFAYKIERGEKEIFILLENDLPDNYS